MKIKCFECRTRVICDIKDPAMARLAIKRQLGINIKCKCGYINEL